MTILDASPGAHTRRTRRNGSALTSVPSSRAAPRSVPGFRVPMSSGGWRVFTEDAPEAQPPRARGLYQREKAEDAGREPDATDYVWTQRARLPYVHARIIRRDGSGRRFDTDYLLSTEPDGPKVIVPSARVRSGEWAGALGIALSDDPRIIQAAGTAIRYMEPSAGDYAGEREAVPRIGPDGKVMVPVAEVLPDGYLMTSPASRAEALALWRSAIVPVAASNPRMALALGAAVVGPYLGALVRQSHVVDLDGDSDQGKTTTLRICSAVWGNPWIKGGVCGTWNGTKVRVPRLLGLLGILPAFLDERGLAPFGPAEWGQVIYSITEGPRQTAESRGQGIRLTAPWDGIVLSAGNGRMLDGLGAGKFAGVNVKRVVSLSTPFTRDAEQAESVIPALRDAYGHPGMAVLELFTVARVGLLIADSAALVGMPAGGNARSLAKNLHGHVAGAAMLDLILGTGTALRDAAALAAREHLEANGHDPEHDADRMLTMLRDSLASAPASWPTVSEYREHKMPKPTYGHDGTPDDPGRVDLPQHGIDRDLMGVRADNGEWFAVFGVALGELLGNAGADRSVALAEADRRGWLHRTDTDRRKGQMTTFVRHVGRAHRFELPAAEPEDVAEGQAPEPGPAPAAIGDDGQDHAPDSGACPGCGGVGSFHAYDCADLIPLPPEPEPDEYDQEPERPSRGLTVLPVPDARDQDGQAPAAQLPARSVPEAADPEPPFAAAVRAYLAECVSAGLDRRYHPTADGAVKMIGHHGKAEADMIRAAFTAASSAVTTAAEATPEPAPEALTEPAGPEPEPEPQSQPGPAEGDGPGEAPEGSQERSEPRATVSDEDEVAAFTRAMRKLDPDATDADLVAALGIFHAATDGVRWVSYAGQVGQAWFSRLAARHASMKRPEPLASAAVKALITTGPLTRVNYTARPSRAIRTGKHYVTSYDLNGQHAAAAGSAEVGDGEPQTVTNPRSIAGLVNLPGYVRLGKPLRTGHPAFGTLPAGQWVAMPLVKFLAADLGLSIPAAEVVYWPSKGRRLSVYVGQYRAARDKLMAADQSGPVRLALAALKSQANAFVGMFHSETYSHGGFYRPDWYDMIVSTAEANALRALAKCPAAPVTKMADTAYWISDQDPFTPEGLIVSGQLGKWKLDRHGPVTPELIAAIKEGQPASVRDAVIRIDAERRATA